jgi:hypothetical protein
MMNSQSVIPLGRQIVSDYEDNRRTGLGKALYRALNGEWHKRALELSAKPASLSRTKPFTIRRGVQG